MRVVMLAPEVHPYAKTGGLADVLAALPAALNRIGVEVSVCLPAYRTALRLMASRQQSLADRLAFIEAVGQAAQPDAVEPLLALFENEQSEPEPFIAIIESIVQF